MKNLFLLRDNLFATVFVFVCIIIFSFSFIHIGPLNPLGKAMQDFDFSDLLFKHRTEAPQANQDIVLVNIGRDRKEIAEQIRILNKYEPSVIALDAWFAQPGEDSADQQLISSLGNVKNLVMGIILEQDSNGEASIKDKSFGEIGKLGSHGFMNLVGENEKTIRYWSPFTGDSANSLGAAILKLHKPEAYQKLKARGKEAEYINYRHTSDAFTRFDNDQVTEDNPDIKNVKGKIVIIGYLGEQLQNSSLEDLHFTPFNPELSARSNPDHYGAYIHANAIAMVLADDFVDTVPDWLVWLISILICYLHMVFFIHYYVERHIWFHLVAKIIQLVTSALLIGAALWLLNNHNLKINTGYILIPIILSVDLLYFYDGLVKWLHKKYGYKTHFMSHHH